MTKPTQLTSVKVNSELFDNFKSLCIKTKCDFRTLVDQSLKMYIEEESYRNKIHERKL